MANYEGYQCFLIEKMPEKKIIVVTMNRPEWRNPVDGTSGAEMRDIFAQINDDDEVNAVVLTGAGKAFSSGGNMRLFKKFADGETKHQTAGARAIGGGGGFGPMDCTRPVIAAVNGDAIGAGSNLALQSDIVIMAEDARIGDLHVSIGLVAGDGGVMWPLYVGLNKAKELIMTGDLINGKEAERIGLINHAVPREEVLPTAISFAERLAHGAIQAASWNKQVMNQWARLYMTVIMPLAGALEAHCFQRSEDHKEAVTAFLEKRQPNFKSEFLSMIGDRPGEAPTTS